MCWNTIINSSPQSAASCIQNVSLHPKLKEKPRDHRCDIGWKEETKKKKKKKKKKKQTKTIGTN